jgi:hypothetical protein
MKVWRINECGEIVWVEQKVRCNPKVGIFWMVKEGDFEEPVVNAIPFKQGHVIDGFISYGDHWRSWRLPAPVTQENKLLRSHRFDHYPRGHVVYSTGQDKFIIYADPCLTCEDLNTILEIFDFGDTEFEVRFDGEYSCSGCDLGKNRRDKS